MNYFSIPGMPRLNTADFGSVLTLVCHEFKVSITDVVSKNRQRYCVEPRHIVMWIMCKYCGKGRVEVGSLFKVHWTTVVSAHQTVDDLMHSNQQYKKRIYKILSMF